MAKSPLDNGASAMATVRTVAPLKVVPGLNSGELMGLDWRGLADRADDAAIVRTENRAAPQASCCARRVTGFRDPASLRAMPDRISPRATTTLGPGFSPRNTTPMSSAQTGIR
jgi:hypothetical protein